MRGLSPAGTETASADHLGVLRHALSAIEMEKVRRWGGLLARSFSAGHQLLTAGNGGSAAQAQHLAAELVGRFRNERPALRALSLAADTTALTAISNDYGYAESFARQLSAHGRAGDVLMVFSTSGRSLNVVRAAEAGHDLGLTVLAVTGPAPNPLVDLCDDAISIPTPVVSTVQECQLVVSHALCAEVDVALGVGEPADPGTDRSGPELVVVGDALLDQDLSGQVRRLSPEAPVPAVDEVETTGRPGGAGLAAVLAAEQGRPVTFVTALADDRDGRDLASLLRERGVRVIDLGLRGPTPRRMRIRANGRTLLMASTSPASRGPLLRALSDAEAARIRQAGAILVSDYAEGTCADASVRGAVASAVRTVPVVWDPHVRGSRPVAGVQLVTPNANQAAELSGRRRGRSLAEDVDRAQDLLSLWGSAAIAVTRGSLGAILIAGESGSPQVVPGADVPGGDTCGAGDRFAVEAAWRLADRALLIEAVTQGVRVATGYVRSGGPLGIATRDGAAAPAEPQEPHTPSSAVERVRAAGGTVVATGGCFDILHTGHVALLEQARGLGHCLVVCLNDDQSIRRLKGPSRPVTPLEDRIRVLRSLAVVDQVEVFSEDLPVEALRRVRPHLYVKGGDYRLADIREADVVAGWGGRTVVLPYTPGRSTTRLIESLASSGRDSPGGGP